MEDLISVVVPVYKVEKYLPKCLDSIAHQTYNNLEIILVDDGSPDRCGAICNEYAANDERFIVIHKSNGGLSDARNVGLLRAKGKYISFIDSDDWVEPTYIQTLYNLLIKNSADLVSFPLCPIDEKGVEIEKIKKENTIILNDYDALKSMFSKTGIPWCAQAKLYKKELFDGVTYPVGFLMEDKATTYKIFAKCKTIVFSNQPLYKYLVRSGSIMRSGFSKKKLDSFQIQEDLNRFMEKEYPDLVPCAYAYTVRVSILALSSMVASNYKDEAMSEKLFSYMNIYKKHFYKAKFIDRRYKMVGRLILMLRNIHKENIYSSHAFQYICNRVARATEGK